MRHETGFTLIELMIAVAVVAILTAIALPSYTSYVQRGKITEASATLSELRLRAEKYFADNRSYQPSPAAGSAVGFNAAVTGTRYFTYACVAPNANQFTCTATGVGDMGGFAYNITESNLRGSVFTGMAGWTSCATRWVIRKGDGC